MSRVSIVEEFLAQNLGWKIDIDEKTFERKIERICQELGYSDIDSCIKSFQSSKKGSMVLQAFAREFSVGESYFFRDLKFFDYLQNYIIPSIIEKKERSLSVWSVGCSRGEELYSIAMILQKMIPDIDKWNLYLLGTDVNPNVIDSATKGVFGKFSFRQIPKFYMSCFKSMGELYEINQTIKNMVHFKYYNIMDDPYRCLPPDGQKFDLILIKNVFIYFEMQKAKVAADALFSLLKEGGFMATTPAEYGMGIFNFAHSKRAPDGYLVQKLFNKEDSEFLSFKKEVENIGQNSFTHDMPNIVEEVADNYFKSLPETMQPPFVTVTKEPLFDENNKYQYYKDALEMVKTGNSESAKNSLRQVLYLDKDLVMAHIVLANMLKKEKKFKAAKKHIDNAKAVLAKMQPQEEVELADGVMAADLLVMLNAIKEEKFE